MVGDKRGPEAKVTVTVQKPVPAKVTLRGVPKQLFVGTTTRLRGKVLDKNDVAREDLAGYPVG